MADDRGAIHYLGSAPAPAGPYDAWQVYGLDQLWEMVRDEDGVASFTQVGAWHRMAELCSEQADQLQRALDQLMVHWPARPGSAAELFQQTVVRMIGSMRDSAATAAATRQPLTDITMALGRAKDELGVLVARKAAYERQEKELAARGVYPGRGATAALAPSDQVPPEGWRQQLDQQARRIMSSTDAAVGAASGQIRSPAPYQFDARIEPLQHDLLAPGGAVGRPVPPVPFPGIDPPRSPGEPSGHAPLESGAPVLAGARSLPSELASLGIGDGSPVAGDSQVRPFSRSSSGSVLVPGAVIGGLPVKGSGTPTPRQSLSEAARSSTSRDGSIMTPPGRGMVGGSGGPSSAAIRPGGRRRRRNDPTDPWAVPRGGPSVLEPDPEPVDHDPGPGVIGIDR